MKYMLIRESVWFAFVNHLISTLGDKSVFIPKSRVSKKKSIIDRAKFPDHYGLLEIFKIPFQ